MPSDFSVYTAGEVADWMSQGTVSTPPSTVYVALFDDTNTEVSTDFANNRVAVSAGTGWTIVSTGFENAADVDFGEATVDVNNIQDVALYDAATGGNELARYTITEALFDVASGTIQRFLAGDLSFDVVDRTE